ncbi:MAG: glycerophosphodiester phosphodiesterase [Burkholderiales bacterium]|nr:glycerophosphodiester phosphodiesterase [Burkholderiales bacterium]
MTRGRRIVSLRGLAHAALVLGALAAAGIGVMMALARPAATHGYFAAERNGVQVIAHRGGAWLRPENTLPAFEHALALGADILEMDARATSDGVLVALHDATVDRTTDGRGRVDAMTLAALRGLDAGYRWSPDGGRSTPFRGRGIRVPTLAEVFERFPRTRMVVEIKPAEPALAAAMCALIRGAGMTQHVLVASMHDAVLDAFRARCPEVGTSMGPGEARLFYLASLVYLSGALTPAAQALQIPYGFGERVLATAELAAAARGRNLKLHVWTVNDEARMRQALAIGVNGIMTDRPDLLLGLLGRSRAARG